MGTMLPYGAAIKDAIESNSLEKMKAVREQSKRVIHEQGDLEVAFLELQDAIQKLESK